MRATLLLFLWLLVPMAGCGTPDALPTNLPDPQLTLGDGPPAPGRSGVFRVEGRLAFFVVDPAAGLMSFHGIDTPWSDLCSGTPPEFDPVDLQLVFSPAGAAAGFFMAERHTVFIYPEADLGFSAGPEDCPVMATLPLVARGSASLIRTDNDLLGSGGPRSNAFGWESHGVLDDPVSGGTVGYGETVRFVIDQTDPPAEITPVVVSIRVR